MKKRDRESRRHYRRPNDRYDDDVTQVSTRDKTEREPKNHEERDTDRKKSAHESEPVNDAQDDQNGAGSVQVDEDAQPKKTKKRLRHHLKKADKSSSDIKNSSNSEGFSTSRFLVSGVVCIFVALGVVVTLIYSSSHDNQGYAPIE